MLAALQIAFAFDRARVQAEQTTLAQAAQASALVDAQLHADLAIMDVLATADMIERRDWAAAFARAREVASLNPHWRNVIVSDLTNGVEVFSLRQPYSDERPPLNPAIANRRPTSAASDIVREGPGCPCAYAHLPMGGEGSFLLTVALDPDVFRRILERSTPSDATAAVVDQRGYFIARSIDHDERVGTPATVFVREAVESGALSGLYEGTTYEGLRNHTAFVRSSDSGWAVHIAVPASRIDWPRSISLAALGLGIAFTLAIGGVLIWWALRDMAARKQAEERFAQTQKLEAIGQLTGGVAHDFNNLLTVIIGGLNMLLRRIEDPKQREIAEHMLDTARRGDRLTKQLLAFSRGKQLELAPVDLHALASGMADLLKRSIGPGVTLTFDLDPSARWVMSDVNQIELAILNLVINARDAMPDGGAIVVSLRSGASETIELAVRDTGVGMPKDVAERAMEPFFTTKPAGKGTGLGLAQVFGAARQSGGSVEIESRPGRGTTIRMLLPRAAPPAAMAGEVSHSPSAAELAAATPGAHVLVVDDEAGVRSFMADALRGAGYRVSEAAHPGEALLHLDADAPDMLITDFSMPGMTGLELAERARAKIATLKVLIVSGYADAESIEASAAGADLLRKPFDEKALLAAVHETLA